MICVIYALVLWLVARNLSKRKKWPAFARKVILGYNPL